MPFQESNDLPHHPVWFLGMTTWEDDLLQGDLA